MGIRSVERELEAKLSLTKGGFLSSKAGKLERKQYADGEERLKISLRNLKAQDGSVASVIVDGVEVARIEMNDGGGSLDNSSSVKGEIPDMDPGQLVEVKLGGEVVAQGELRLD